jgi:hypothetical protein
MAHFREWELARFQPLIPGMDVLVRNFACKHLPRVCFEIYEGGKEAAMRRRRRLRDADPKRQERKRIKRLNELKAKMAEIQKKKEEKKAGDDEEEEGRKRKRSDADLEEDEEVVATKAIKTEDSTLVKGEEEEENEAAAEVEENEAQGENETQGEIEAQREENEAQEEEEANLLESVFDTLQDTETGERKTREEAEADRQKLLAGELEVEEDYVPSDDEDLGYTGDGARESYLVVPKKATGHRHKDIRALPLAEDEAEILRKAGYTVVSDADEETKVIGGNLPKPEDQQQPIIGKMKIKFRTKFDIVELDANGHVIDKGDEDFAPSKTWIGRKAGFEFKLGVRGVGYYRTGKKVVIPSNTAY